MSRASYLPIYKEASRLVGHLYSTTKKAPRELRHTLVSRLLGEAVELVVDVDTAHRLEGKDRLDKISVVQQRVVRVSTLLSTAFEQRCLSTGAAAMCIASVDSLGAQAEGWRSFTAKGLVSGQLPEPELST